MCTARPAAEAEADDKVKPSSSFLATAVSVPAAESGARLTAVAGSLIFCVLRSSKISSTRALAERV